LTATADQRTRKEIATRLDLENAQHFLSSFDRPNIQYRIAAKDNPKKQLLQFLREEQRGNSGIVYCLSRNKVESTASWLCEQGYNALPYHAGLSAQTRAQNQRRFLREDEIIIVATIAFGMGIDKPDVRFVAHLDLPKSIEAYYQETGRAGRDGQAASALLLYGLEDVVKLGQMAATSDAGPVRNHQLPPTITVALFWRRIAESLRQLRQLPGARRNLGCGPGRGQTALLCLPHRPALWRRPCDRCIAR
jgi:ATP-dependent DNA helicase RecQ